MSSKEEDESDTDRDEAKGLVNALKEQ